MHKPTGRLCITLRLQLLTGLRPDCHFSSFSPIGLHLAELLGSALRFLLTLRPAIVVSLREAQGFLSHACRCSFGVATRRPTGPSPHAPPLKFSWRQAS